MASAAPIDRNATRTTRLRPPPLRKIAASGTPTTTGRAGGPGNAGTGRGGTEETLGGDDGTTTRGAGGLDEATVAVGAQGDGTEDWTNGGMEDETRGGGGAEVEPCGRSLEGGGIGTRCAGRGGGHDKGRGALRAGDPNTTSPDKLAVARAPGGPEERESREAILEACHKISCSTESLDSRFVQAWCAGKRKIASHQTLPGRSLPRHPLKARAARGHLHFITTS